MRLALLLLTLTVCWTANAQSTIANGTLNYALLNQSSLINGLVSYWKLDEAGTGTRYDSWGNNNLTANNSPSYADGKVGNCARFISGSSQSLSVTNSSLAGGKFDFTFALWIYSLGGGNMIFGKGNYTREEYMLQLQSGKLFWNVGYGGSALWQFCPTNIANNVWYFVVAGYNSGANSLFVSVNNGPDFSTTSTNGSYNSGTPFSIGKTGSEANYYWNGYVDEFGFWKRVLSSDERTQLYKSGTGCTYPSFSRRSQPLDFDWDNWQPLQLPEQIPVAFVNRKPELLSLCE